MVDITKCSNSTCPKRHQCYRYMVKPGCIQSYSRFKPDEHTGECEYFMNIEEGDKPHLEKHNEDE